MHFLFASTWQAQSFLDSVILERRVLDFNQRGYITSLNRHVERMPRAAPIFGLCITPVIFRNHLSGRDRLFMS